jgi:hypothetical protein
MDKVLCYLNPQTALIIITSIVVIKDMAIFPTLKELDTKYATKEQVSEMKQDIRDIKILLIDQIKAK